MIVVWEEGSARIRWNKEATFQLEMKLEITADGWVPVNIMTSYNTLGIEDAQAKAKWWIEQMEANAEEQRDVE